MDQRLFYDRMSKFTASCQSMNALPEIILARGELDNGRGVLMFLSGPVITMEHIKEIRMLCDAKELAIRKGG